MTDFVVTESRPGELLDALHAAAIPELEHVFAHRRADPSDLVLVAWSAGSPVGYLVATVRLPSVTEVWEHAVAPDHRHRGIGRTLLYELARRIPQGAVVRVDPAHHLDIDRIADYYTRCGFAYVRETGEIVATAAELLRATGRSPAGGRGPSVKSLIDAKDRRLVTVPPELTIDELVAVFNDQHIGAAPVSTDGKRVEGIVSERDVLRGWGRLGPNLTGLRVNDLMTRDVVTCTVVDGIELVMSLMTRLRIRHVPVTEAGQLVGVVSIGDIVRQRLEHLELENQQIHDYIATGR
jgi:CBS domain-containing protein